MTDSGIDKYLDRKIREATHSRKRKQSSHEKIEWKQMRCTKCQKRVEYVPKEGWDGKLICPHCGHEFRVPSLDGWLE
jgi:rRNA maturation endonuclease Nob1